MPPNPFAVVAGVGPGTGAAVARRFAKAYPVVLLARNPDNFKSLVEEINGAGGKAFGISTDVSSEKSVREAFEKIKSETNGADCAAAIFNASGKFSKGPFLEQTAEDWYSGFEVSCKGAFNFAQSTLPLLLAHSKTQASATDSMNPGTLIFTGATASTKSSAQFSSFAAPKHAKRALALSLAREFGPQGVHVAHAVIDGVIDIPKTKEWLKDMPAEAKISAEEIAETYWSLHVQGRRGWANEIDIRPMLEKF
ncbi:hypothetical protein MBLNU230_g1769t1 [Neophaeotheca triangularis]